ETLQLARVSGHALRPSEVSGSAGGVVSHRLGGPMVRRAHRYRPPRVRPAAFGDRPFGYTGGDRSCSGQAASGVGGVVGLLAWCHRTSHTVGGGGSVGCHLRGAPHFLL